MDRIWQKIGEGLSRRGPLVLGIAIAVSLLLAVGATKLTFATGQDSYLNADSKVSRDNRAYQSLFGGQAMITVYTAEPGKNVLALFTPANRKRLEDLLVLLQHTKGVHAPVTPLTAMEWNQALVKPAPGSSDPTSSVAGKILLAATQRETTAAARQARLDDATKTIQRLTAAGAQTFDNPEWVKFLLIDNQGNIREPLRPFFPTPPGVAPTLANATRAEMVVRLGGNQTTKQEGAATTAVKQAVSRIPLDGFSSSTTGAPALLKDVNDYLMGGMFILGGIAVVVMVIVLSSAFRVRSRLLPLLVMAMGVVWTFGLLGFLGFQLSVVTIAGLPILIGLGVEFAIQVHNRIEEELVADDARSPFSETLTHVGRALLVASVAGVIACLALEASLTPMIRDFGVLLAVGVAFVFLAAIIVPTAVLSIRERRSPTTVERQQPVVSSMMRRLSRLPSKVAVPLVVMAVALFGVGLYAEQNTPIQTDPNRWVDQNSQVIRDINGMQAATGASSELGIYVQDSRGVFSDQTSAFVTSFATGELAKFPGKLSNVSSLPTTVFYLMRVPGATALPPTGDDLRAAFAVAPAAIRPTLVSADGKAQNIVFQTGPSTLEVRKEVIVDVRRTVHPPAGVTATPSGLAVIGVGLLDNLTANRLLLTELAVAGVLLWLLVRFRTITRAVLVMVPVMLAVGLAASVVKLTGITVSPLTTVSSPLVIAICTEFASLILFRHMEERSRGLSPHEAVDVAAARTGRAFFASSLTTVGGFAVLLFSPLPLLRDFGAIVAITIAIALLSAMVALPPVLVWADEHGLLMRRSEAGATPRSRGAADRAG